MIRFVMDNEEALIFDDTGAENGWCFRYDSERRCFLVWDNVEREIMGDFPKTCYTLEDVLRLVNSYT